MIEPQKWIAKCFACDSRCMVSISFSRTKSLNKVQSCKRGEYNNGLLDPMKCAHLLANYKARFDQVDSDPLGFDTLATIRDRETAALADDFSDGFVYTAMSDTEFEL